MPRFSLARLFAAVVAIVALTCAWTATAAASEPGACDAPTSTPFAPWGDHAHYALVPDGGFEAGGEGWVLSGGASVVEGNEPFLVAGADHSRSLRLPAGASALSPPFCVTAAHPTIRFFARGGLFSTVLVSVVIENQGRLALQLPVGAAALGTSWRPPLPMPLLANLLAPLSPTGELRARLRFTALLGTVRIDDVHVDPWKTT